jgi:hypothetical protein
MCTVSVIHAPTLRIACNRDELLTRSEALPPRIVRCGDQLAVMPIDPASGGTWIAVNDAGVAFTLLNVNPAERPPPPCDSVSRGLVIPSILHHASASEVQDTLDAHRHEPFRLIVVDDCALLECVWDGERLRTNLRERDGRPEMFTSSGLGDRLVTGPRSRLFESFRRDGDFTAARQEQFHRHRWADAAHLSVCMSRREARTVSYATIEVTPQHVVLSYLAGGPDADAGPSHWCLKRA